MRPDGWSDADDVSRWEALEAEARSDRTGAEALSDPRPVEAAPGSFDSESPSRWGEQAIEGHAVASDPEPGPARAADILLADADAAISASIEQAMTARGWLVRRADNGELALAEFRRLQPDCFVFDYSLPGIGGLDLLRRLAELGVDEDTRLVVNSAQAQTIHVKRALAMGADRFLDRPRRSSAQLVDAVAEQLEQLGVGGAAPSGPSHDAPPPAPEPAPGPQTTDRLFADAPAATPSAESPPERSEGPSEPSEARRSYRAAFGTGGGPPGKVPRLG